MRRYDVYISPVVLFHYGVKGMKWGVRRSRKELQAARKLLAETEDSDIINLKTSTGLVIRRVTKHEIDRAKERGVSKENIVDALTNPLCVRQIKYDNENRPSQRYIGRVAVANVNPEDGSLITVWKTSSQLRRKYERMGK